MSEAFTPTLDERGSLINLVDNVIEKAIDERASDIHLEPYESHYRIRFRIDGMLHEFARLPIKLNSRFNARVKVMAGLDVAEHRLPQDGRILHKRPTGDTVNLRANTLATLWGEKVVLRILQPLSELPELSELGMSASQLNCYLQALTRQQGLVLVTGPTGSGKTVTLYSGLSVLNTTNRNVSAAEDPVEIDFKGINQISINPGIGLDFAKVLRALLRQDPDVIMVGEIRDLETAQMAMRAAQTGHLVLSTLHTNSAAASLSRLCNMGVATFNIAHSIRLIIAQRLVRRLCNECKIPLKLSASAARAEGFTDVATTGLNLFTELGCEACSEGFRGRVGVYELLPASEQLSRLIINGADTLAIEAHARSEGYPSLRTASLQKVREGTTSLNEANRLG